tara:strand:+ start:2937 stop:3290 length:354 start_codon:yes stop_codon:yes gene_type:complete
MVLATSLTLSKTRVANYLAAHRQEALFASAQDPGAATGMSDATAIRKVRKLEFAGLDEMLRFLCRAMQDELALSNRMNRSVARIAAESANTLAALFDLNAATLKALRDPATPTDFCS